jgi:hypothetical protein
VAAAAASRTPFAAAPAVEAKGGEGVEAEVAPSDGDEAKGAVGESSGSAGAEAKPSEDEAKGRGRSFVRASKLRHVAVAPLKGGGVEAIRAATGGALAATAEVAAFSWEVLNGGRR